MKTGNQFSPSQKRDEKKNKRQEILSRLGNKTYSVFYTGKFPKNKPKNAILSFGNAGYIEKQNEGGKTFYRVYDPANDRIIDLRDDSGELELIVNQLKNQIENSVRRTYRLGKYEKIEFDEGTSFFSPNYDTAIDAVATLDYNGKLLKVPFGDLKLDIPALDRSRFEGGTIKREIFIKHRYTLDALHSIIKNKFAEFQVTSEDDND